MPGGRQGAPGFDPGRLRTARKAARLSQSALAEAAHVHVSSVRDWEAGRQVPRIDMVAAIARALDIAPADLLQPADGTAVTLQQLRAAAGRSQQQLADAVGMLRNTYSAVERGETATISYADIQALAVALGVTAEEVHAAHTAARTAHLKQHPRPNGNGHTRPGS